MSESNTPETNTERRLDCDGGELLHGSGFEDEMPERAVGDQDRKDEN